MMGSTKRKFMKFCVQSGYTYACVYRNFLFESVCLPNTSKSTRCHILKSMSKCGKPVARPPLKCIHRELRLKWAENNMKVNFENVIFTDECRATLDGPNG